MKFTGYWRVKEVTPITLRSFPHLDYKLYPDDVLTKEEDGTYTKHTGLCIVGLELADEQVEYTEETARLALI